MIKLQARSTVRHIVERSIAISKKSTHGTWADRIDAAKTQRMQTHPKKTSTHVDDDHNDE